MRNIERLKERYKENQQIKELVDKWLYPKEIMEILRPNEELSEEEKSHFNSRIYVLKDTAKYEKEQRDIENIIPQIEECIKLYNSGLAIAQVAKKMDVSTQTIIRWLRHNCNALTPREDETDTEKRKTLLQSYHEQGKTIEEVAELLGVTIPTIKGYISSLGFSFPSSKLEEQKQREISLRAEIMQLRNQGLTQKAIAQKVGRTQAFVSTVLTSNGIRTLAKRTRITREEAKAKKPKILELYLSGVTNQNDIASQLQVSQSFVSKVLSESIKNS